MGVKAGTKRGPYKKNKNEKNIIKTTGKKTATTKTDFGKTIDRVKQNDVDETILSGIDRQEISANDINGNNQEQNQSSIAPANEPQSEVFQETSGEEKLKSFFDEYEQVNTENSNTETTSSQTDTQSFHTPSQPVNDLKILINGYMLLSMCDVVFPFGIKFLFGLFNPKAKKVSVSDMRLTQEQKDAMMASADQVAAYVFEKANPLTIFIICLGLFYGTNFQTALSNLKE